MKNPFEKIKLNYLYTLYKIISESEFRNLDFIKTKYIEFAKRFDETLYILKTLNFVNENQSDQISINPAYEVSSLDQFKDILIISLLTVGGDLHHYLEKFLEKFNHVNERFIFHASDYENIKHSETRNLLLELGFITSENDGRKFIVNPDYSLLFRQFMAAKNLSPRSLKSMILNNEELGLNCEIAVMDFEKKRLINIFFDQEEIEHISQINTNAGYDIKSFEDFLDSNSNKIERYIEVKCVSSDSKKFYWSRNEIEKAKELSIKYFLYLVPVTESGEFDFYNLEIVQNPYYEIFHNKIWDLQIENYSCKKIQKNT